MQGKKTLQGGKFAAAAIGGMILLAGVIIVAVLIRDTRPAVAARGEPAKAQSRPDRAAPAVEAQVAEATAACPQLTCMYGLLVTRAGWRCGHATLAEALTYWQCEHYVSTARVLLTLEGDASLEGFSLTALIPERSTVELQDRVRDFCIATAEGLLPGAEAAIADARLVAIDRGAGLDGYGLTATDWRIHVLERLDEPLEPGEDLVITIDAVALD